MNALRAYSMIFLLSASGVLRAQELETSILPDSNYADDRIGERQNSNESNRPANTARQAKNIGDEFLDIESSYWPVSADTYDLVKEVSRRVKARLPAKPKSQSLRALSDHALNTFAIIDQVMTELNFVQAPSTLASLTFGESLTATKVTTELLNQIVQNPVNWKRKDHILANSDQPLFLVDCDTASMVYLAVGEELGLPLFLAEAPQHIFIRWYFNDRDYLNWETVNGTSLLDVDYIQRCRIPQISIRSRAFLSKMSRANSIGLCHSAVGAALIKRKRYSEAKAECQIGIQWYDRSPLSLGTLALLIVTCPNVSEDEQREAIALANKAVETFGDCHSLTAQAMAYGKAGDFDNAIKSQLKLLEFDPTNANYLATLERFRNRDSELNFKLAVE